MPAPAGSAGVVHGKRKPRRARPACLLYLSGPILCGRTEVPGGDGLLRSYLFEAANVLLNRHPKPSKLKTLGLGLAARMRLESDADPSDLMNPMGVREIAVLWSSEASDGGRNRGRSGCKSLAGSSEPIGPRRNAPEATSRLCCEQGVTPTRPRTDEHRILRKRCFAKAAIMVGRTGPGW